MTIIKSLSLNALEKQSFKEKIQEKVTAQFNLAADFSKLQANEIDYSVLNEGKDAKMDSTSLKLIFKKSQFKNIKNHHTKV